ncbi:MAG: hypothetical protein RLZZ339_1993 [Cyanobacteriota bacterium]
MKLALKGAKVSMTEGIPAHFEVIRSLPHGHVMAILETIKKLGLDRIISEKSSARLRSPNAWNQKLSGGDDCGKNHQS